MKDKEWELQMEEWGKHAPGLGVMEDTSRKVDMRVVGNVPSELFRDDERDGDIIYAVALCGINPDARVWQRRDGAWWSAWCSDVRALQLGSNCDVLIASDRIRQGEYWAYWRPEPAIPETVDRQSPQTPMPPYSATVKPFKSPDEGLKYDDGKLQYSLFPSNVLAEIVKVLTYGARKYAPENWRKVANGNQRYLDALYRHVEAWRAGEWLDPESKLPHLAHAACCVIFLLGINLTNSAEAPDLQSRMRSAIQ